MMLNQSPEHTPSDDSVALRLKPSTGSRRLKADFVVTLRSLKRHALKKQVTTRC